MPLRLREAYHGFLRTVLPGSEKFWNVYSPVIRILQDSSEHKKIRDAVTIGLNLRPSDTILDAGCGRADWLAEVSHLVKMAHGVDFEQEMMNAARLRTAGLGNVFFHTASLEGRLLFEDGSIDKIASILVHGYLGDRLSTAKEYFRILAPGGMLAIVTPRKEAKFFKVLREEARQRRGEGTFLRDLRKLPLAATAVLFGKIAELKDKAGQWHFYDKGELEQELTSLGFEMISTQLVYADQAVFVIARKP